MSDLTRILSELAQGDARAAGQLLPLVYDELRKLAAARLAREAPGNTLDARRGRALSLTRPARAGLHRYAARPRKRGSAPTPKIGAHTLPPRRCRESGHSRPALLQYLLLSPELGTPEMPPSTLGCSKEGDRCRRLKRTTPSAPPIT